MVDDSYIDTEIYDLRCDVEDILYSLCMDAEKYVQAKGMKYKCNCPDPFALTEEQCRYLIKMARSFHGK